MKTGAKIAVGCAVFLVLAGIAAVVGVVGIGYWTKGKVEGAVAEEQKIQELHQKADARPFVQPTGGTISEDRLLAFIDVRKRVFAFYETRKAEIDTLAPKRSGGGLTGLREGIAAAKAIQALRLAHAQALADVGMSQAEYRFMVEAVYKTAWMSEIERSTDGRTLSEATGEAMARAAEGMEQSAQATPDPSLPPEAQRAIAEAQEQIRKQQAQLRERAREAQEQAAKVEVPQANVELFRKHEAEIKQYAMTGLEWVTF